MADKDFVVKNGFSVNGSILVVNTSVTGVGINTSSPDASLKVVGTANVTGNAVFSANLTVSGTIFGTLSGIANNASYLGGTIASSYALKTYADSAAATAYSNGTSYSDTKAATAYSNAISYADTVAATAYSNAVSYVTSAVPTLASNATTYVLGGGSVTTNTITVGTSVYFVANGNVGFGMNNPAYKIDVTGAINATGDITSSSDLRLKINIEKIEDALNKIIKLQGVTFNKIGSDKRSTGLIAQDVAAVLPEAITETPDGFLSVAYGNMVGLIIEAIKELKVEVDKLKHGD